MNEIIDLSGITFPWWIPLTIFGVLLVAGIALCFGGVEAGLLVLLVTVLFGAPLGLGAIPATVVSDETERKTVAQLFDMGYTNVRTYSDGFNGSKDGKYIKGAFVPASDPDTYYVVELPTK